VNLLDHPWIPIRRRSGKVERIAPYQLSDAGDPAVGLESPRPDFDGALAQFLVGLLQTASPPRDEEAWEAWLDEPPSPGALRDALEPWRYAFETDGDGSRFLQDHDELTGAEEPISHLLIDAPATNTLSNNADHFIKRGQVEAMCPACAAAALLTLQLNAPSGGAGHRTSLRGGGPLTTLVAFDPLGGSGLDTTLWRDLWLNVLNIRDASMLPGNMKLKAAAAIMPWLAPTRTSEAKDGIATTPEDAHPLQMYWAMPRRVRLNWEGGEGRCDLCGGPSALMARSYVTRNYGVHYSGGWRHPLTPYREAKEGEWLPVHPQPGGMTYRDWLGLSFGEPGAHPAAVVSAFLGRKLRGEALRLWAFGYDMDNMKPRCWYESRIPLYHVDAPLRADFALRVQALIDSATGVSFYVQQRIKDAWVWKPRAGSKEASKSRGDLSHLKQAFLASTEAEFYSTVERLIPAISAGNDVALLQGWHMVLCRRALQLFDRWTVRGGIAFADCRRIAEARNQLTRQLYGKTLRQQLMVEGRSRA